MQRLIDRWKVIGGTLLVLALSVALAGVYTRTEPTLPLQQEAMAQAPALSSDPQTPGDSSQLRQVALHITGMS